MFTWPYSDCKEIVTACERAEREKRGGEKKIIPCEYCIIVEM